MDVYIAILATLCVATGDLGYIRGIVRGNVLPTKSSWLIFAVVAVLNLSSFLAARFDVVSGMSFISDTFFYMVIAVIIFAFSRERIRFKKFEKYYFFAAFVCATFWFVSNNPFATNLLAQLLLTIGYIPTIHNLLLSKESTESKFSWILWTTGSFLILYPAIANHNTLAIIFSLRAIVLCSIVLFLVF